MAVLITYIYELEIIHYPFQKGRQSIIYLKQNKCGFHEET